MYFHAIFFRFCPATSAEEDVMIFYPLPAAAEITDTGLISGKNAFHVFLSFFSLSRISEIIILPDPLCSLSLGEVYRYLPRCVVYGF